MTGFRYSAESVFLHLTVMIFFLSVNGFCGNQFKATPEFIVSFQRVAPIAIKISYDEKEVAVGLQNATVAVFSITGQLKYMMKGCHNSKIKSVREIRGNGWISLDINDNACRWTSNGSLQTKWSFKQQVYRIQVTYETQGYAYIAFNFGDVVYEYHSQTTSPTPSVYYPDKNQLFQTFQYDGMGNRLFAATYGKNFVVYNCSTKAKISSIGSTNQSMRYSAHASNGDVLFTDKTFVYRINSSSLTHTEVNLNPYGNQSLGGLAGSQKNSEFLYITFAQFGKKDLIVYDSTGKKKQVLTYSDSYFMSIDATTNYLAYTSTNNCFGIATYKSNKSDDAVVNSGFPIWVIILISLGSLLIFIGAIVFVVSQVRKRRLMAPSNSYQKFNEASTNQSFSKNLLYQPNNFKPRLDQNNSNRGENQIKNSLTPPETNYHNSDWGRKSLIRQSQSHQQSGQTASQNPTNFNSYPADQLHNQSREEM